MGGRGSRSMASSQLGMQDSMWGFERYYLPKKEFGKVMHAIDTNYDDRFVGETWGTIPIDMDDGTYLYTFIIFENGSGENTYRDYFIIDKERIR